MSMSDNTAGAEQDAILALLRVGGSRSKTVDESGGEKSEKKIKTESKDEKAKDDEETDEETAVGSPVATSRVTKDDDEGIVPDPRPQTISPLPEQSKTYTHMGMPLRKLNKKRKYHKSVDGQFEDADESFNSSFPTAMMGKWNSASSNGVLGGYPPAPSRQNESSKEQSVPPPPPHLIQQTSNEYAPPPPAMQSQTSAELARQAMAFQQQRSLMESGVFPPHYAAAMMAGGAMKGAMGDGYMDQDRLMQFEAMMALQAQIHMARQGAAGAASKGSNQTDGIPGLGTRANSQFPLSALYSMDQTYDAFRKAGGTTGESSSSGKSKTEEGEQEEKWDCGKTKESHFMDHKFKYAMQPSTRSEPEDDGSVGEMQGPKGSKTMSTKERFEKYKPPSSWGEICRVPKMPHVKADDKFEHPIEVLRENDVMLGRGGLSNQNEGNIRFRNLVRNYRTHYCTAPKGDKGALSRYLCNYVRALGGRFLQKNKSGEAAAWYEVGDEKAVSKCGQALREGTSDFSRTTPLQK